MSKQLNQRSGDRRRDRSLDRAARAKTEGEGFLQRGKACANSPDYHGRTMAEVGAHASTNNVEEENLHGRPPQRALRNVAGLAGPKAHFRDTQGNAYI
jgi:hypothetical protein